MIVSISRRTDIPALYSEWLMNRLRAGEVLVPHPRFPNRYSRIPLSPKVVDLLVFWSKNPIPLLPYLEEIADMGYSFAFQFTITPYDKNWEPALPDKHLLLETFSRLSARYGAERMIWRYDPVLLSEAWTLERHLEMFRKMCGILSGKTNRCVFSFLDLYKSVAKRVEKAGGRCPLPFEMEILAEQFSRIATSFGIQLSACAEAGDYTRFGVTQTACVEKGWVENLLGCPLSLKKDSGQRESCGCVESVDIGCYDTCTNGCLYCYGVGNGILLHENRQNHLPDAPSLTGFPPPEAQIYNKTVKSSKIQQLSLL